MNTKNTLAQIPSAAEFAERIRKVSDDLLDIARDLVVALDAKPELMDELIAAGVNRELVNRLERLGRGQIHPRLVFSTTVGAVKLLALPLSAQTRALDNGIEVMEDDESTQRIIPVNEMTPAQARQAFNRGHIRSLQEQRTWLRAQKKKRGATAPTSADYRIYSDHVATYRPGRWPKKLLLQWLSEMK